MDDPRKSGPLSFAQQEVWLRTQLAGDIPFGNLPITIRCPSPLDVPALEAALHRLAERHETLRTTFGVEEGRPVRFVSSPSASPLEVLDLRSTPGAECHALALAIGDARRALDLVRGPAYRARLIHLAPGDSRLYLTLHQAIADRASIQRVLLTDLAALYAAELYGTPEPAAVPLQYGDFAAAQREWVQTAEAGRQIERWRRRLAGPPPTLELFTDRVRPPLPGFRGARHRFTLDARTTDALRAVCRAEDVSVFIGLLTGFVTLLHRYTGEVDLVLGTLADGARSATLKRLLGCFVNPLALRIDVDDDPSFRTLLGRVRTVVAEAFEDQELPFEYVVNAALPSRDRARYPLFSYVFSLQPPGTPAPAGWALIDDDVDSTADFDLHLDLHERVDQIVGRLTYRADLFEPDTIARLAAHFARLLEGAVADLDCPVSRLPMLDERERHRVVVEWNRTAHAYPAEATVHGLVEEQAARASDRIALVSGAGALTYGELNRRADAVAARLQAFGVTPGAFVGVAMERSIETIVGYLAVLKAGAAYVPLSINDPPDRAAFMVAEARISAVLTRERGFAAATLNDVPVVDIDEVEPAATPTPLPPVRVGPDDIMYVMYTSGSTGYPKGVAVPHRGIVRLLFGDGRYMRLGPDEVILQSTALGFDVSVFEIWAALVHGARLVLYPSPVVMTSELRDVIRRHGVTTMWLTPAVFNMVVDEDPECLAPLRQLDLGGEALSVPHVARASSVMPKTQIINGYGPTECSVAATAYRIPPRIDPTAASIPIGAPIANTTAYVLDRHLVPTAIGVPGELYLGGPGVARGYVNRPDETAARFIPDHFDTRAGAQLYRTGDLARWRPDGILEYLGRLDSQVKIRGLRIELGEIEAVLRRHPQIRDAAVVVRQDGAAKRLVTYVVGRAKTAPPADELREHVRKALPAYMVPTVFVPLDALPLTPSGKVDRRGLTARADSPVRLTESCDVGPGDSLEGQLAALWQELLNIDRVGLTDDFFELGGDSLTAARMLQQIGDLTGCSLPLSALYSSPTIEALTRLLRQEPGAPADLAAPAVTLNGGGDRTPLFLFHGLLTGGAFYALRLARRLGRRQPVHVVHPFTGVGSPIPATIEAMVDRHMAVVRSLQPCGPYRLAGYCNGGLVAYEIARRLHAAGEHVDLLALIAAVPVTTLRRTGRLLRRTAQIVGVSPERTAEPVARLRAYWDRLSWIPPRERPAFVVTKLVERASHTLSVRRRSDSGRPATPSRWPAVLGVYNRVFMRYFPAPYSGPLLLLWPEHEGSGSVDAAATAWRRLVPSVTVRVVPGDHLAIVHDQLDVLATHLDAHLSDEGSVDRQRAMEASVGLRVSAPTALMKVAALLAPICELA